MLLTSGPSALINSPDRQIQQTRVKNINRTQNTGRFLLQELGLTDTDFKRQTITDLGMKGCIYRHSRVGAVACLLPQACALTF